MAALRKKICDVLLMVSGYIIIMSILLLLVIFLTPVIFLLLCARVHKISYEIVTGKDSKVSDDWL